jgi:hypothetical protein
LLANTVGGPTAIGADEAVDEVAGPVTDVLTAGTVDIVTGGLDGSDPAGSDVQATSPAASNPHPSATLSFIVSTLPARQLESWLAQAS